MGNLGEIKCNDEISRDTKETNTSSDGYICHRLQPPPQKMSPDSPKITLTGCIGSPELYQVVREACAQQNVKWPLECQVLPEPIHHIQDSPLYPEQFYQQNGRELRPQPVGDEMGRVVYQYYPTSTVNYFTRSCVGGNKQISREVRPPLIHPDDTTLQFESRFESANLAKAVQISDCYYELHIRADLYTARHTQWFYFSISNTRKDVTYRFSIVNLSKGDSLYNHGLRPLLYSEKEANLHNIGWRRCGSNIVYFRNQDNDVECYDSDDEADEDSPSFTLSFNITFPHDHDTVFLAHCYPYSYSLLQQHLLNIQNDPFKSSICRQRILCRSMAGNAIYLLTITGHDQDDDLKKKRAIVLTARVHPGETPASWIMKGVLDFLTSEHPKAADLRRQFVFKIIPMVNPDGVIVGNHRCSLVGRDLNRQYKLVVKELFPAVWHIKAMVRRLMDEHGVVMYCDFHAHSRKHNIFLYGCENRRNHENHLREQIFPLVLHYNAGDKFSFRNCKFRVQRCKEGTARVVVWMMGVLHSYTLESSFGGASEGGRSGTHFSISDLLAMGRQFTESLHEYFDSQPSKEKLRNRLWTRLVKKGSNADEPTTVDLSDSNSTSDDSDHLPTPSRSRRKRLVRVFKKKVLPKIANLQEKSCSKLNVSAQETTGSSLTYIDKMGDLITSQLALSDNDVDSLSRSWPDDSPDDSSEKLSVSTSHHDSIQNQRSEIRASLNFDTLEPVVAKTRLHDPKTFQRPPRSPVLSTSVRTVHFAGKTRVKAVEKTTRIKRSIKSVVNKEILHVNSSKCFRSQRSFDDNDLQKKTLSPVKDNHDKRPVRSNSLNVARPFSTICQSLSDNHLEFTENCEKKGKKSRKENASKISDIDEDQLCADIANCDTLFLDIGVHETPELKAARNLKGRVKKKKENQIQNDDFIIGPVMPLDSNDNSVEIGEPKIKQKIKIVIGKKPKKSKRKLISNNIENREC